VRDLAGRPQSRPRRRAVGLRARPVEDAAGVVDTAGKPDRMAVGEDVLATGTATRAARDARTATEEL
jgi:hypothetical protein